MADPSIPQPEMFDTFQYVPESQSWQLVSAPSAPAVSLEDLTGGAFFQRGPNLYRSVDSAYVGRVAYVRGATIERGTQGSVILNNRVPLSRVDDNMGETRQPRLVVNGNLSHLGDTQENPINRIISLAPRGDLVYVRDDVASGKARYQRVIAPALGEPVARRLSNGWRLATSEEMVIRGMAGWLARNATAAIERAKLEGIDRGDGTKTTDGSEIVRILAADLSVEPVITQILTEHI